VVHEGSHGVEDFIRAERQADNLRRVDPEPDMKTDRLANSRRVVSASCVKLQSSVA
jgi:hypothetical protein